MQSNEKIMHDRPELDTQTAEEQDEDKATLADALANAMKPIVKPLAEDHPDEGDLKEQRVAEDAEARD